MFEINALDAEIDIVSISKSMHINIKQLSEEANPCFALVKR
jgi:hypothetical protein